MVEYTEQTTYTNGESNSLPFFFFLFDFSQTFFQYLSCGVFFKSEKQFIPKIIACKANVSYKFKDSMMLFAVWKLTEI
jgi:hypothetical protein